MFFQNIFLIYSTADLCSAQLSPRMTRAISLVEEYMLYRGMLSLDIDPGQALEKSIACPPFIVTLDNAEIS